MARASETFILQELDMWHFYFPRLIIGVHTLM